MEYPRWQVDHHRGHGHRQHRSPVLGEFIRVGRCMNRERWGGGGRSAQKTVVECACVLCFSINASAPEPPKAARCSECNKAYLRSAIITLET